MTVATEPRHDWLTSLAFWLCLVFASFSYALVVLSPKLLTSFTLDQQRHVNQLKLVELEKQVTHMQKVIEALQHDPAFAKQLAHTDFERHRGEIERIPVSGSLALIARPTCPDLAMPLPDLPWYSPVLRGVAHHRSVSNALLLVSAGIILYAFACLHDRSAASPSEA